MKKSEAPFAAFSTIAVAELTHVVGGRALGDEIADSVKGWVSKAGDGLGKAGDGLGKWFNEVKKEAKDPYSGTGKEKPSGGASR